MPSSFSRRMMRNTSCTMAGARPSEGSSNMISSRLAHQAAADRQHLLLAAGQRAGRLAPPFGEAREHARRRAPASAFSVPRARGSMAPISRFSSTREGGEDLPALGDLADAEIADASGSASR